MVDHIVSLSEQEIVSGALLGNADAINLYNTLARTSQLIDDFIDRDKPVDPQAILASIIALTVDMPRNRFYRICIDEVVMIIEDAWQVWVQATELERGVSLKMIPDDHAKRVLEISYIKRSAMTDLLIKLARLVGGREHENKWAFNIRCWVYLNNENFAEYAKEHGVM